MGFRLRERRVFLMGGEYEGQSALAMSDLLSAEGSTNMRLVKPGVMRGVEGYATKNSSAITTNGGGDATRVIAIFHYKSAAGARRDVVVVTDDTNEVEIWHSTDASATFSFLADVGSGAVGLEPQMAQWESDLFICFGGSIAVQKYDGSSVAAAGQTQPTAPSAAVGAAGTPNGTYKYKTANIAADGTVGPYSAAVTILLEDEKCDLTSITLGAGGARIARTTGDGAISEDYFILTDTSTNSHTDGTDDKTLKDRASVIDDPGDAPPSGAEFAFAHRARFIYLKDQSFHFSPVGKPESIGGTDNSRIGEGHAGDSLILGVPDYEGEALLFYEQSIYRLAGNGKRTYNAIRSMSSKGTVSKHSAALIQGGAKFFDSSGDLQTIPKPVIAYMTDVDLRIFGGNTDEIVSWAQRDTFKTLSYQHRQQAWCRVYEPYNWLICAIPTADQTYTYRCWDMGTGHWHPVDMWPQLACAVVSESASDGHIFLAGRADTAGIVYELFTGANADGSDITATFRSVPLHNGDPASEDFLHAVLPVFEAESGSLTVTQNIYENWAGSGASAFATDTIDLQLANANFISPDDAILIKDSNGLRSRAKAHIIEYTLAGQNLWGIAGWTWWYQRPTQKATIK